MEGDERYQLLERLGRRERFQAIYDPLGLIDERQGQCLVKWGQVVVVGQVASLLKAKRDAGDLADLRIRLKGGNDRLDMFLTGALIAGNPPAHVSERTVVDRAR